MPTRQELVWKRLTEEGGKMLTLFEALPLDQRTRIIYTDGAKWTVKDILAHQVSTERAIRAMLDNILAGGAGAPEGFAIDAFNEAQVVRMTDTSWEGLLEAFRVERAGTAALALRLTDAQLNQRGRHPFLGITAVEDILQLLYRHNMMHVRDIHRTLGR